MNRRQKRPQCIQCRYFRNSPEFLEMAFKGLTSLSSAYGSVRSEDGICIINGRYLAATHLCYATNFCPTFLCGGTNQMGSEELQGCGRYLRLRDKRNVGEAEPNLAWGILEKTHVEIATPLLL